MARRSGGVNDDNRDGTDDDVDRQPGNRAMSKEYAQRYDPRSESEYSYFPADRHQLDAMEAERRALARARGLHHPPSQVQFGVNVGKFVIPKENTWAAHAALVKNEANALGFDPNKYIHFDKVVAESLGNPALFDPNHKDYGKYQGLRNNIAVLRNDLVGIYMRDGTFDPGDEIFIPKLRSIATALGEALNHDTWYKRPFTKSLSVDVANVEGVGAAEMYTYLLENQTQPIPLEGLRQGFNSMLGISDRNWELPPLEVTPFSPQALAAPPPSLDPPVTMHAPPPPPPSAPMAAAPATAAMAPAAEASDTDRMLAFSENALRSAERLQAINAMATDTRSAAIEEARTILRWLRNLQFGEQDVETWLDQGTPPEKQSKLEMLSKLITLYHRQASEAVHRHPELAKELAIQDANDAAGGIALALEAHMQKTAPGDPGTQQLALLAAKLSEDCELQELQPVNRLLDSIELGFSYVSTDAVYDKSPADRLLEMSNRIQTAARKLRSIETMEQPARLESVELAREILRKLKNLSFSNKPMEEVIDTGRPEDKAALAQKLHDMVEMYKALLEEAVVANPELMNDPRVKAANDAVGSFAYGLKLMAAKEMPNSVAAAQQISADVTQMPEEWKALHDRTVDRLLHSMEGGLEKAVEELATQQQEQQQDQELAQEAIEANLTHIDQSKKKRRRKRRQRGSGLTKAAARRNAGDLNGDGILDKLQGINIGADNAVRVDSRQAQPRAETSTHDKDVAFMRGMKAEDVAAIRKLGGSLRNIGEQLKGISPSLASVEAHDKIAPDDKTAAQRVIEENQKNPRGPGPRTV